jgi:hypothetical protein
MIVPIYGMTFRDGQILFREMSSFKSSFGWRQTSFPAPVSIVEQLRSEGRISSQEFRHSLIMCSLLHRRASVASLASAAPRTRCIENRSENALLGQRDL